MEDLHYLQLAINEAEKCIPSPSAFSVGCVLVTRLPNSNPLVLSTGYSRELPGNTHAEANALSKASQLSNDALQSMFPTQTHIDIDTILHHTDVYTTMEPCSIRTSGLRPCADALVSCHIKRCLIGVGEPVDFVVCEGAQILKDAGIEVVWIDGLQDKCLATARRGHEARKL